MNQDEDMEWEETNSSLINRCSEHANIDDGNTSDDSSSL